MSSGDDHFADPSAQDETVSNKTTFSCFCFIYFSYINCTVQKSEAFFKYTICYKYLLGEFCITKLVQKHFRFQKQYFSKTISKKGTFYIRDHFSDTKHNKRSCVLLPKRSKCVTQVSRGNLADFLRCAVKLTYLHYKDLYLN